MTDWTISDLNRKYLAYGYSQAETQPRVAHEILLHCIASSRIKDHVTVKGGVLIQNLSRDDRRATVDVDLDFLHFPIREEAVRNFIAALNDATEDFSLSVQGEINELKHIDYKGKRVVLAITDSKGAKLAIKLDLGVHSSSELMQVKKIFELKAMEESIELFANPAEQVIAEKLKSLLRFGTRTTRIKDISDIYFLLFDFGVSQKLLDQMVKTIIFEDASIRVGTYRDIVGILNRIFGNQMFMWNVQNSKDRWLDISASDMTNRIVGFFKQKVS